MTTIQASFGTLYLGSSHWVEVEIAPGVDFRVEHCTEMMQLLEPQLQAPYVVLGHCRHPHSMDEDAMAQVFHMPGCAAIGVALYPTGEPELCRALETMAQVQQASFRTFQALELAKSWLERELSEARGNGMRRALDLGEASEEAAP